MASQAHRRDCAPALDCLGEGKSRLTCMLMEHSEEGEAGGEHCCQDTSTFPWKQPKGSSEMLLQSKAQDSEKPEGEESSNLLKICFVPLCCQKGGVSAWLAPSEEVEKVSPANVANYA
ncbi:hypothetical protein P7K49_026069 [Saguinus oedipus]|uniref:Uncharacterized protein n=1 Tax=Saguinus oedipus TaxID=9490 RepID=A0ABQ9UJT0_SAGOE|nr:hypothetical protein P7K49_026069 [Saguinus oedipus]